MKFPPALELAANQHPFPLLFATISGAHLYGFPSPDSDYDLRGVHVLPMQKIAGLDIEEETIELSREENEIELDLVTHDAKKFFRLMLKKNGYVLEQLYSPLIIRTCPEHDELKEIAKNCITRHHSYHYLGFAQTQWRLFTTEVPPRVKPLLYVYRVLLTGIHLMRTGTIEANLVVLNEQFRLPHLAELIDLKLNAAEKQTIGNIDIEFHKAEYERLRIELEIASRDSKLPELPSAKPALNDLLVRLRMKIQHAGVQ
jgi:predicted nucleotidyltransferase